jgi:hypothetical protein
MKEEGLSLKAIARCLDQMKGKKWHPEMIKRNFEN